MKRPWNTLGYPRFSKNYGITNGGIGKLYSQDGSQIVDFVAVFKIGPLTGPKASAYGYKNIGSQIAYENTPGGWNSALYSLNSNDGNIRKKADTDIPYTRATFIPTASAFGIKVTQANVGKDWKYYRDNKIATPFDIIRGMNGINEEHVKISVDTKKFLIDELQADFNNTVRPRVRSGQVLSQKVKGKEVGFPHQNKAAYKYEQSS